MKYYKLNDNSGVECSPDTVKGRTDAKIITKQEYEDFIKEQPEPEPEPTIEEKIRAEILKMKDEGLI